MAQSTLIHLTNFLKLLCLINFLLAVPYFMFCLESTFLSWVGLCGSGL